MKRVRTFAPLALIALSYLALLVGALCGNLSAVAAGALGTVVAEEFLHRASDPRPAEGLLRIDLGPGWRSLCRQALVVVFVLRSTDLGDAAQVVLVCAVLARQLVYGADLAARLVITRRRLPRVVMRNFGAAPDEVAAPSRVALDDGSRLNCHSDLLVALALFWAVATGWYGLIMPAAVAAVALALGVLAPLLPATWALLSGPRDRQLMRLAQQAVRQLQPQVLLYFSGGADAVYQVNMWLDTMERLERPVLVLLRERRYLDELTDTVLPVLCLPYSVDFMNFEFPDARVALYVANVGKNIHLLRDPALKSAFIGHGDSDKTASFNPFTKVYDQVWVAGEAGRDRYLRAQVGVRAEQIVTVGRPQLAAIRPCEPRAADAPFTVLYAPTWEGWTEDHDQSSLIVMGERIVTVLLATPGVRVLFRPHPFTGTVDNRAGRARDRIAELLASAGGTHRVTGPDTSLYDDFNESDALISDISSVVSDYLRSAKPYFVTNIDELPADRFRAQNPSAAAAYLIGTGASGLADGLAQARGDDPLRARRAQVGRYLVGAPEVDALQLFRDAVAGLVAEANARSGLVAAGLVSAESEVDEPIAQSGEPREPA